MKPIDRKTFFPKILNNSCLCRACIKGGSWHFKDVVDPEVLAKTVAVTRPIQDDFFGLIRNVIKVSFAIIPENRNDNEAGSI